MPRRFLTLLGLVLLPLLPASAQRTPADVRALLEGRDRQVKAVLGTRTTFTPEQRAQLATLINGVIDFEEMGQRALGATWSTLTPQQRAQFVDTFAEIVRNQSLADLAIYRAQVRYGDVTVNGATALARTTTTYRNATARVDYALVWKGNAWRVSDISIDGVSTADGYARSFGQVVRQRGFPALMQALNRRLAQQRARG
jgi:phospholipid transport system substrate-binding protein